MIDLALDHMARDETVGIVYPDDPHIYSWTKNLLVAEALAKRIGHSALPCLINFPVGTMFWMRSHALQSFVNLSLNWSDYPHEPLPIDGTMLHALERLFGTIPILEGWTCAVTNIREVTR